MAHAARVLHVNWSKSVLFIPGEADAANNLLPSEIPIPSDQVSAS